MIVPVYNCQDVLDRCVKSILKALWPDSEIIIVNDGSTDGTLEKAVSLQSAYHNVRVITQQNGGVSVARNSGILNARGKYVSFVDADDWILPPFTLFRSLYREILESKADMSMAGYTASDGSESLFLQPQIYQRACKGFENLIMLKSIGKPYGKLISRSFLLENDIKFPEGMRHQEDAVFLYRVLSKARSVITVPDQTYNYVIPGKGKTYSRNLDSELCGYKAMSDTINALLDTLDSPSQSIKVRLYKRVNNLATSVFYCIQQEPLRENRIRGYKQVRWLPVLPYIEIHPLKKHLLRLKLFSILDTISSVHLQF